MFCVFTGQYTCKEGKNSPCLVYVSFNHKIYVYWKVKLERMESTNLLRVLEEKPEFKSRLKLLGVGKYTNNSEVVIRKLIQFRRGQSSLNSNQQSPLFVDERPTVTVCSQSVCWTVVKLKTLT